MIKINIVFCGCYKVELLIFLTFFPLFQGICPDIVSIMFCFVLVKVALNDYIIHQCIKKQRHMVISILLGDIKKSWVNKFYSS